MDRDSHGDLQAVSAGSNTSTPIRHPAQRRGPPVDLPYSSAQGPKIPVRCTLAPSHPSMFPQAANVCQACLRVL